MAKLHVMEKECPTCPFRDKSPVACFRPVLEARALCVGVVADVDESGISLMDVGVGSPICHSTGDSDVVHEAKKLFKDERLCRGARDLQLKVFADMGFISAATDEAWNAKCKELGLETPE